MMFEYSKEKLARFESIFSFKNECVFIYQNILEKDMNYVKNPTEKKVNKNLLKRERERERLANNFLHFGVDSEVLFQFINYSCFVI